MNEIMSSDLNKFVGVDFHVHTPASQCYKGSKTDSEYIEILRRYVEKEVKVIAITDHNTLKGYRKLKEIEKEYINKLKYLSELSEKYPVIKTEYEQVKSKLELFSKLLILPGIEFEANPGVHLLLIFSPECDLSKVESFLIEAGYTDEVQGKEDPGIVPKCDVLSVLNEASSLGALVIAPHADSNKGIYNSLPKNQYRANVFRSNNLNAISYNNPITCQKMKVMLKNKEYKRESPVAFIQCSDYHGDDEAATCITYLKLEELDFESVCDALKNPNECVSPTQHPKIINILKQIINDHKSFVFENLENDEDISLIKRAVCAILNDGYGTLVIGAARNPEINIIGISMDKKDILNILKDIFKSIKPTTFSVQITGYEYGRNRHVIVVQLARENNTISYIDDNDVYILKNNQIIKANPTLIEKIVEDRIFKRIVEHQKIINNKYKHIIREIELVYCIIKMDKVAKEIPHFCNRKFPNIAKGH
ncbi:MAG TPA: hypothetical protein GXX37_02170 [Clostridiaceae bacterium]|nr:hypothetical protein [Clostridiaceae bacterium]